MDNIELSKELIKFMITMKKQTREYLNLKFYIKINRATVCNIIYFKKE